MEVEKNIPIKLRAEFSLETEELYVYVNGSKITGVEKMYINPVVAALTSEANLNNINRIFDSDSRGAAGTVAKYTIDNVLFKRISLENDMRTVFEENFDTTSNSYAVDTAVKRTDTDLGDEPIGIEGSVEILRGENSIRNGVQSNNSKESGIIYRVYKKENILWLEAVTRFSEDETGKQIIEASEDYSLGTVAAGQWYTLRVDYNTDTLSMNAYLNGKEKTADKNLYIRKQKDYKGVFSCDNRNLKYVDLYLDNIKVTAATPFDRQWQYRQYKARDDFNQFGVFTNIKDAVMEEGKLKISGGTRSLTQINEETRPAEGVYSAAVDLQFEKLNTNNGSIRLISAQSLLGTANAYHFEITEENGSLYAKVYTGSGEKKTAQYIEIMKNIDVSKIYNFRYSLNLETRCIHFYIDDIETAADVIMYANPNAEKNIARPFDFDGRERYDGVLYVDNYILYKDIFSAETSGFDSAVIKTENIVLPSETASGAPIVWLSSDANAVNPETGAVTLPSDTDKYYKKAVFEYTMTLRPDILMLNITEENNKLRAEAVV